MDNRGTHETHEPGRGPSARRPADAPPQDRDEVTLKAQWRSGQRTRAWDELWARLLDGLVDRDPDSDDSKPPGAPPAGAAPDS